MSKAPKAAAAAESGEDDAAAPAKGGKKKLLLIAAPVVVLVAAGAGLWFTGILPSMLGMGAKPPPPAMAEGAKPTVFVELPEIVSNLNSGARRPSFVKMKVKLELAKADDQPVVMAQMPRVMDLVQTYLRETRPEELRGAEGTWRLRRELVARADLAVAPAHISDVLFTEMLVQ